MPSAHVYKILATPNVTTILWNFETLDRYSKSYFWLQCRWCFWKRFLCSRMDSLYLIERDFLMKNCTWENKEHASNSEKNTTLFCHTRITSSILWVVRIILNQGNRQYTNLAGSMDSLFSDSSLKRLMLWNIGIDKEGATLCTTASWSRNTNDKFLWDLGTYPFKMPAFSPPYLQQRTPNLFRCNIGFWHQVTMLRTRCFGWEFSFCWIY